MKRVGIITMHRIINYGSLLQAYALQQEITKNGYDNEIIDYVFPVVNSFNFIRSIKVKLLQCLGNILSGGSKSRCEKQYHKIFKLLNVTKEQFTHEDLIKHCPCYDIYLTGSDQVWNPNFIGENTDFMFGFLPNTAKCVSYASSFAVSSIPSTMHPIYRTALSKYSYITVREKTGVDLVNKICQKKAEVVCDPVLLLSPNDWDLLEAKSDLKINYKYILVYALTYMYDPFPQILNIIDEVQNKLGLKVVFLNGSSRLKHRQNSEVIKDIGPSEFIHLFKNAEFVISTSYHGTAFANIYRKPVLGVVNGVESTDNRIYSILSYCGNKSSIISYNEEIGARLDNIDALKRDDVLYDQYVLQSKLILKKMLSL